MTLPSASVIGQLGPDRRRALRDARQQLDVVEAHADGAVGDLVAEEQHARLVRPARAREAAYDGDAGRARDSSCSTGPSGTSRGREQDDGVTSSSRRGPPTASASGPS